VVALRQLKGKGQLAVMAIVDEDSPLEHIATDERLYPQGTQVALDDRNYHGTHVDLVGVHEYTQSNVELIAAVRGSPSRRRKYGGISARRKVELLNNRRVNTSAACSRVYEPTPEERRWDRKISTNQRVVPRSANSKSNFNNGTARLERQRQD
jgi:hypothetical protein